MRSACSKALVRLVLPFLLCSIPACSADKQHLEKQLSKLEDEVRHLESETNRMGERLDAVEARNTVASHNAEERMAANATTVTRPKLKIVRVEPGADDATDDGDEPAAIAPEPPDNDTGPRLVIQGEGKSIESHTLPATAPVAAKSTPVASKAKADSKANKAEAPSSK